MTKNIIHLFREITSVQDEGHLSFVNIIVVIDYKLKPLPFITCRVKALILRQYKHYF